MNTEMSKVELNHCHLGSLVTISSPSSIVKPLVAVQPQQPPPAYGAAEAPSHQHEQRPNPKMQQDQSRSVQPMYTVVDGDAIALLQYTHPTAPRTVVLAAKLHPPTPWTHSSPPTAQRVIRAPPSRCRRKAGTQHRKARRCRTLLSTDVCSADENLAALRKAPCHPANVK